MNVNISYRTEEDYSYMDIYVKSPTDELVSPDSFYYILNREHYTEGSKDRSTISAQSVLPHIASPILYNAATNVLIYYTRKSNCYVSIYPESLAKTLKCYCCIRNNHLYLPEGATVEYI